MAESSPPEARKAQLPLLDLPTLHLDSDQVRASGIPPSISDGSGAGPGFNENVIAITIVNIYDRRFLKTDF